MSDHRERLVEATAHLDAPLALLDKDALERNADDLVRRAAGLPVRVATKSVRVRSVIERTLTRSGFGGVMTYSLAESVWLADHGVQDILLAYPAVQASAIRDLVAQEHRRAAITVMVDSVESLEVIIAAAGAGHPPISVCLDIDCSLRPGVLGVRPVHLGVRRSPVRTPRAARAVARAVEDRPGFELSGLMFYDAQVAGLPDTSPAVRWVKRASDADLLERRHEIVAAVGEHAQLRFVNAGGTGSLEACAADPVVTELTAGSGLFMPTLFDRYDAFEARPAAYFALDVVRRPARSVATCFAGGYIASGSASASRQPSPVWPEGLELTGTEGAGEVQTPVTGRAARDLRVGDRVLFRHAKAGEMCERFDELSIVGSDGHVETVPTYRGEGRNFG
ncbi:alanine racemase [Marihabitans asiaticum]|uniref:alanine racemase n=1 Tax=Marihabitans asiaticum TaxID=415218 RepID=UPI00119F63D7|nr:alanine racemase [Marihabitans asiaticum]